MNLQQRLHSDWPYPAARAPFFYGWVIALISTLGFLFSVPGQTMGMAVFSDTFIETFGLTRTELSTAYLFGTVGSALFLTRAGRWYDRYGARVMLVAAPLVLGATLCFISMIDQLAAPLASGLGMPVNWAAFALILLGYFGVRFSGQGVLTSASRNVLLVWFDRRRGLVSGVRGVFVSLGFSIAPLILALMIGDLGWRGALWAMAAVAGLGFSVLALITVRDNPAVCNLHPDGVAPVPEEAHAANARPADRTVTEARRDPVFWLYSLSLSIHALFGTAVTFHVAAIFIEAGRSREAAFAYFLPQAIVSVLVNLSASAAADYCRLKPFLVTMLAAFLIGAWGVINLHSELGYWMLVLGFGAGGGLWGVLSNLAFIRQYGARYLGEISGLNTAITVFASAIGPVAFSAANDLFGTFDAAAMVCMVVLVVLLIAGFVIRQPADVLPRRG